jgi:short-subunit dehydrogenase
LSTYPFTSALVTGASSGIGEAMTGLLVGAAVPTVVVARRADRLEALAAAHPDLVEVLPADLLTEEGVAAVAARLADPDRPVDLLVNNAGFGSSGPFADTGSDRLAAQVRLNCEALTVLTRAAVGPMRERGGGWVCNVASVAAYQANPNLAVYAATKAYVLSLGEALAEELHGSGVRVTTLCPGLTRTEFQEVSNTTGLGSNLPDAVWMSAEQVAREALADTARGKAVSVPGYQYKPLVALSQVTPHWVKRKVAGLLMHRN